MIKKIYKDEDGSVLFMISAALVVIFGVLALTINLSTVQSHYQHNYNATDAATLSTAEWILKGKVEKIKDPEYSEGRWLEWQPSTGEITKYAKDLFITSIENGIGDESNITSFEANYDSEDDKITVSACISVNRLDIAKVLNYSDGVEEVCAQSEAKFALSREISEAEIALSVDLTGSMGFNGNERLNALKFAMNFLFDEYVTPDNQDKLLFSIVPFAFDVYFKNYQDVLAENSSDVKYVPVFNSSNLRNNPPNPLTWLGGDRFVKISNSNIPSRERYAIEARALAKTESGKNKEAWNALADELEIAGKNIDYFFVQPLTGDVDLLKRKVNSFEAFGGTLGITGILGAWLTLHEGWQGKWSASSPNEDADGASYDRAMLPSKKSDNKKKYIIHMTDGEDVDISVQQIGNYTSMIDDDFPKNGDEAYKPICEAIKGQDIEIFIILLGTNKQSYHDACLGSALKDTNIFENIQPSQLQSTYETIFDIIATKTSAVRLSK